MSTSNNLSATVLNTQTGTVDGATSNVYTYQTIGPLTTTFTPPPQRDQAYLPLGFGDYNPIAYSADCRGERAECLPDGHVGKWVVYSPGLYCPVGWYTVAIITNDDSSYVAIHEGESTAICCPSFYTVVPAITEESVDPQQVHNFLHCGSTKSVGLHILTSCGFDSNSSLITLTQEPDNVVWSEIFAVRIPSPTDVASSTSRQDSRDMSSNDDIVYHVTLKSTPTSIITAAAVIQLVWRQVDLEYEATHRNETRLPVGGIVGLVIGVLLITLAVLVGLCLYIKKRKQSRRTQDQTPPTEVVESKSLEDTAKHATDPKESNILESKPELDAISTVRLSGPTSKPELPATPMARHGPPVELMHNDSLPVRYELDGDPGNQAASSTPRPNSLDLAVKAQTDRTIFSLEEIASRMVSPLSTLDTSTPLSPPLTVSSSGHEVTSEGARED
ncbi:hypothetical protein QBC40DRAFT_298169 [Triangularia verruculosa]|uniref:Uncharacterized protein n=1 Tax=Triangularia verruculosa TaxID=2587418 RepID=A0AAN7ART2_9PEZI|nr:hypothetical protein QBC40DRAFT_298169 [Triangularia verruculosa]